MNAVQLYWIVSTAVLRASVMLSQPQTHSRLNQIRTAFRISHAGCKRRNLFVYDVDDFLIDGFADCRRGNLCVKELLQTRTVFFCEVCADAGFAKLFGGGMFGIISASSAAA